ncbi:MAG: ABC transporter permease [Cytophagales bacterium]|nr:ABC transporter permease [Cytophagales bacterium]
MFKTNLRISLRNLIRNKSYSLINILGLSIGMGVCLAILQYVQFESSYDGFHTNAQDTYRLTLRALENGEVNRQQAKTSYAIAPQALLDIPDIESYTRIHPQYFGAVVNNPEKNNPFMEEDMLFADSTFLEMFDFELKQGNRSTALDDKYSIVLTEEMADKYFGSKVNPIGKTLKVDGWVTASFKVTGVLKTIPGNSHLEFDFLMPMQSLLESESYQNGRGRWGRTNFFTYFKLRDGSKTADVEEQIAAMVYENFGKTLEHYNITWEFALQPLPDIYLYSEHLEDQATSTANIQEIRALVLIAIIILIVAWLNFINLSIASSTKRAKDVGVRKALGSTKGQLRKQFIIESFLINVISAVIALFITAALLAYLNQILGTKFAFLLVQQASFWLTFILFIIVSSFASGIYPAVVISSFKAINIQRFKLSNSGSGFNIRKASLAFQFLISTLLISGTFIIYNQITFMKTQDLGVDMEQVLIVKGPEIVSNEEQLPSDLVAFKTESSRLASIASSTSSGTIPGKGHNAVVGMRKLGDEPSLNKPGGISYVDPSFFTTYEFDFLAGEPFKESDLTGSRPHVIINEKAAEVYGLGQGEEALNKRILIRKDTVYVSGVLKDFHWQSLREDHMPILFVVSNQAKRYFSFKMSPSNISETIVHIQNSYNDIFRGNPFNYYFLDDEFNEQYKSYVQFGQIFLIFSILAIFIACLGLFAFVTFSAAQRVKEMSIRKVLGADVNHLILILSKEYVITLIVANVISIPIVIYVAQDWLSNFAFRMQLGILAFLVPILTLFIISCLTVGRQIVKTAMINPVDSIKAE